MMKSKCSAPNSHIPAGPRKVGMISSSPQLNFNDIKNDVNIDHPN